VTSGAWLPRLRQSPLVHYVLGCPCACSGLGTYCRLYSPASLATIGQIRLALLQWRNSQCMGCKLRCSQPVREASRSGDWQSAAGSSLIKPWPLPGYSKWRAAMDTAIVIELFIGLGAVCSLILLCSLVYLIRRERHRRRRT